jgi:cysteine protease ATG4
MAEGTIRFSMHRSEVVYFPYCFNSFQSIRMPTSQDDLNEEPLLPLQTRLGFSLSHDVLSAFGYKYDSSTSTELETDVGDGEALHYEEEIQSTKIGNHPIHSTYTTVLLKNNERKKIPFVFLVGKTLHPVHEYRIWKEYEASLFWFTYRYDFPEIKPYGITSDAGWGCMLRSAQMMLAHTLRVHYKSRHWTPSLSIVKSREDDFVKALLTWFSDFPSKTESIYSLHNMCAAGLANYEVLPGEWYGPGTACHVLRDLVSLHRHQQQNLFRIHVSSEGTVYKEAVFNEMTKDGRLRSEQRKQQNPEAPTLPLHPLDPPVPSMLQSTGSMEWDTSLLLLIPLRLGLDRFNEEYVQSVARTFWLPQSVGILGGRPRGARWFYGAYADGSKVFGLDPHTVQPAPRKQGASMNSGVDLADDYLASVHTRYPEVFDIKSMDPSIALGFYCQNRKDFEDLQESLNELNRSSSTPELVSVLDKIPKYLSPEALDDLMFNGLDAAEEADPKRDDDDGDDEEEYVLL